MTIEQLTQDFENETKNNPFILDNSEWLEEETTSEYVSIKKIIREGITEMKALLTWSKMEYLSDDEIEAGLMLIAEEFSEKTEDKEDSKFIRNILQNTIEKIWILSREK